jgi:hypothetical protein
MNLQFIREILAKDKAIKKYLDGTYLSWYGIKFSNFWFIVIPYKSIYVYKYYISEDYNSLTNTNNDFYFRELDNYILLKSRWFIIPNYEDVKFVLIWGKKYYLIKFENIRINNKKISSFLELSYKKLSWFMNRLHKDWFIHWNIHPSNFYLLKNWEIGIFDLVDYRKWNIEKDLARIFLNTNFDIDYFMNFLLLYNNPYKFNNIIKYCLEDLYNTYKSWYLEKSDLNRYVLKLKSLLN